MRGARPRECGVTLECRADRAREHPGRRDAIRSEWQVVDRLIMPLPIVVRRVTRYRCWCELQTGRGEGGIPRSP